MQEKASNKFQCIESHQFLFVFVFVIAPAEGDFAVCKADQPVIGNCNTMSIAAQIIKHLIRAAERRFGIDDPFRFAAAFQESVELYRIVEFLKRSAELQFAGRVGFLEIVEEKAAEKTRQNANRQKETFSRWNPSLMIGRQAAACNHAMQMRVKKQVLPPGVQHGEKADIRAEVLGIGGAMRRSVSEAERKRML